ncbi:MAG: PQQ-dependent sugar dehydrogenase [Candidatus Woesearchaeota archaeon]
MKWLFGLLLIVLVGCSTSIELNSGEIVSQGDFTFEILTDDLQNPWGMSFLSENKLFITQRTQGLILLNLDTFEKTDILGVPEFISPGQGGLLDVKYYDGYIYLTYVVENDGAHSTRLGRGIFDKENFEIIDFEVLHTSSPAMSGGSHFGSRILIVDDLIYYTTGDRGRKDFGPDHVSQNTSNTLGALIRLNLDGSIPSDNPFISNTSVLDEIYTFGHRNPQGMTLNSRTGEIWISDHGENEGDEINIIKAGSNYGWPIAHTGCRYGTRIRFAENPFDLEEIENPVYYWECGTGGFPPAGMIFYFGERYIELHGDLLIGNLAGRELGRFSVEGNNVEELSPVFEGQRVRDVIVSLDDYIYFITDAGNLIRLMG